MVQAVVKVEIVWDALDRLYHAHSDDVAGLFLTSASKEGLLADIPAAITYLYKANKGVSVEVALASEGKEFPAGEPIEGQYILKQAA